MESRQLLSVTIAPIQLGTVYYEDANHNDVVGDTFTVTFSGGADGTQLTQLVIDGDEDGKGLNDPDCFFDTVKGGSGAFGAVGFSVVENHGVDSVTPTVADGSSRLVLDLTGFDRGDKLVFSIDVDEYGPSSVAEGSEFSNSHLIGTFQAAHYYVAEKGDIFIDSYDDKLATSGLTLPNDDYGKTGDDSLAAYTDGAFVRLEQTPLPASIAGTVFYDNDLNNAQEGTEPGIAGVKLTLSDLDGNYSIATTDSQGNYRFDNLALGTYRVVETQPGGLFSVGAAAGNVGGQVRGSVENADVLTGITLLGGDASVQNKFSEAQPATLSGYVFVDANNDGHRQSTETGIPDVAVSVQYVDAAGTPGATVTVQSGPDGFWTAGGLRPGSYRGTEAQPIAYLDGLDEAGNAGGTAHNPGDAIDGIHLVGNQVGLNYNFGELPPASLSGIVYVDLDGDLTHDPNELLLASVTLRLLDSGGSQLAVTQTNAQGAYQFTRLLPGTYRVEETQPEAYFDGPDRVGSAGGTLIPSDAIGSIVLAAGVQAPGYDFTELAPASLSGRVYAEPNQDPLPGVTVNLRDASENVVATTQTDAQGRYSFTGLKPATYRVDEIQPAGYYDSTDYVGSAGGSLLGPDSIVSVVLGSGTKATDYNFSENLPATLSGRVYAQPGETLLPGVTINLRDATGNVVATTQTDARGQYSFTGLKPATYRVDEIQPAGYYDSTDYVGSAGGSLLAPDSIVSIVLGSGTKATGYDFSEIKPAQIAGYVYLDDNNNGVMDWGEGPVPGVTVVLLDAAGNATTSTAVTDANGAYRFTNLAPGTYGVAENQPLDLADGLDAAGTAGGAAQNPGDRITGAVLAAGTDAVNYNFGELRLASIGGRVHAELDRDCVLDANEWPIGGVTVYLIDVSGNRAARTTTDDQGYYRFTNVLPGVYSVEEVQPVGYLEGDAHVGTASGWPDGADRVIGIAMEPGTAATGYDFCELVPATLSGYVFQDGPVYHYSELSPPPDPSTLSDGQFGTGDTPIANVTLTLADADGNAKLDAKGQPIQAVTDRNGYYEFTNLAPDVYTVVERQPAGYADAIDVPGTSGGVAVNGDQELAPKNIDEQTGNGLVDAIVRIRLNSGDNARDYNFSEVKLAATPISIPPVHIAPPPPQLVLPQPAMPTQVVGTIYYDVPDVAPQIMFLGGLTPVAGHTWHLSVINGGQPRRQQDGMALSLPQTRTYFNVSAWSGTDLRQGSWVIADIKGKVLRTVTFGIRGGVPVAGDWNGDGKAELGVYLGGEWFLDINGDGVWDQGDLWAQMGHDDDQPVSGDWDGDGKTDIGIFGPAWAGDPKAIAAEPGQPHPRNPTPVTRRFKNVPPSADQATSGYRAMKHTAQGKLRADLIDHVFHYGASGDRAVIGDWSGNGVYTIGVFRRGVFTLDMDGDGKWSAGDITAEFGEAGDIPLVGDWNGDGKTELGVWRNGTVILDTNGNRKIDAADTVFQLGGPGDQPVSGDFDGDGVDEVAVYRGTTADGSPPQAAEQHESAADEVAARPAPAPK